MADAIEESADPYLATHSAGLARQEVVATISKVLDVVDGRSDEVDIDGLVHAQIMLDDQVGDRDRKRTEGMRSNCNESLLVALL